jgi:Toprim domain
MFSLSKNSEGAGIGIMAVGEGLETMLSLRSALPAMPMLAALSANHLAAILFPATLSRLYIARDRHPAGDLAVSTLTERAQSTGIEALTLTPALGDLNEDLRHLGVEELRAAVRIQLAPEDAPSTRRTRPRRGRMSARPEFPGRASVSADPPFQKAASSRPSRGRSDGRRPGPATAVGSYFPPPESNPAHAAAPRRTA